MKKHSEALAKITSENLNSRSAELRKDIIDLTRGVKLRDVQNYKMINVKKKELARILTRKANEERKVEK